ncbi:MAG: sulfite exporter TauE/SafE family protein [Candidatus Bathyarchaeia archaeon]
MEFEIVFFIVAGFIAQLIDGTLGMAYGVSLTTLLLGMGVPPPTASMSVHASEIFTTIASGLSHLRLGNVDKKLFKRLLFPGVAGGVLGAYVLTSTPVDAIKPIVTLYLLTMGLVITIKAFKKTEHKKTVKEAPVLALIGGFLDAIGGGGWGPVVTSTLVARGGNPRISIGSVNLAEFFVTVSEVLTFIVLLGTVNWQVVVCLLVGGVLAAPFGAHLCKKIPVKMLMIMVGLLIMLLSVRNLYLLLG